jgi:hypothetical protein
MGEKVMSRIQTTLSAFPARTETQEGLALPQGLSLNVAFTSERATAEALRYAARMAGGLGARLRVIVPQVVPYGRDLNDPDVNTDFTAKRALDAARVARVDADVSVVLCRDRAEGLHHALGHDGLVMIGGGGKWWPFAERRLARQLVDRGHKVLFVEHEPHSADRARVA